MQFISLSLLWGSRFKFIQVICKVHWYPLARTTGVVSWFVTERPTKFDMNEDKPSYTYDKIIYNSLFYLFTYFLLLSHTPESAGYFLANTTRHYLFIIFQKKYISTKTGALLKEA